MTLATDGGMAWHGVSTGVCVVSLSLAVSTVFWRVGWGRLCGEWSLAGDAGH